MPQSSTVSDVDESPVSDVDESPDSLPITSSGHSSSSPGVFDITTDNTPYPKRHGRGRPPHFEPRLAEWLIMHFERWRSMGARTKEGWYKQLYKLMLKAFTRHSILLGSRVNRPPDEGLTDAQINRACIQRIGDFFRYEDKRRGSKAIPKGNTVILGGLKKAGRTKKKISMRQYYGSHSVEGGPERNEQFETQWPGGSRGERLQAWGTWMGAAYNALPEEEKARWREKREISHAQQKHAQGLGEACPGSAEQFADLGELNYDVLFWIAQQISLTLGVVCLVFTVRPSHEQEGKMIAQSVQANSADAEIIAPFCDQFEKEVKDLGRRFKEYGQMVYSKEACAARVVDGIIACEHDDDVGEDIDLVFQPEPVAGDDEADIPMTSKSTCRKPSPSVTSTQKKKGSRRKAASATPLQDNSPSGLNSAASSISLNANLTSPPPADSANLTSPPPADSANLTSPPPADSAIPSLNTNLTAPSSISLTTPAVNGSVASSSSESEESQQPQPPAASPDDAESPPPAEPSTASDALPTLGLDFGKSTDYQDQSGQYYPMAHINPAQHSFDPRYNSAAYKPYITQHDPGQYNHSHHDPGQYNHNHYTGQYNPGPYNQYYPNHYNPGQYYGAEGGGQPHGYMHHPAYTPGSVYAHGNGFNGNTNAPGHVVNVSIPHPNMHSLFNFSSDSGCAADSMDWTDDSIPSGILPGLLPEQTQFQCSTLTTNAAFDEPGDLDNAASLSGQLQGLFEGNSLFTESTGPLDPSAAGDPFAPGVDTNAGSSSSSSGTPTGSVGPHGKKVASHNMSVDENRLAMEQEALRQEKSNAEKKIAAAELARLKRVKRAGGAAVPPVAPPPSDHTSSSVPPGITAPPSDPPPSDNSTPPLVPQAKKGRKRGADVAPPSDPPPSDNSTTPPLVPQAKKARKPQAANVAPIAPRSKRTAVLQHTSGRYKALNSGTAGTQGSRR